MCGFVGFNKSDRVLLERMTKELMHRGPDGEGYFEDGGVSLGHRRLAILDLTEAGDQPMTDDSGRLRLVYNGEIYNYLELKEELQKKGYRFRSRTDTEIILYAYREWGMEMLSRFNGMFAFCLFDQEARKFHLARDRFGIKPLYYRQSSGFIVFASEIKALLVDPEYKPSENPSAIYDYLSFNQYDHCEETFFKGILSLRPGMYLTYDLAANSVTKTKWYDLRARLKDLRKGGEAGENILERFREIFSESLRLRLRTDVEIGACLSGGLDSTSILGGLSQFKEVAEKDFKTFSLIFKGTPFDETPYLDEVLNRYPVRNFKSEPSVDDLNASLETLVYNQEEPFSGTSIFGQWCVMRLSHQHKIKVLLDGQGADELMGGYPFFIGYYFLELFKAGKISTLIEEVKGYVRSEHLDHREGLLTPLLLLAPKALKRYLWNTRFGSVLAKGFQTEFGSGQNPYQTRSLNDALLDRIEAQLPALLREEDKSAMAFSVETRLPYLDYRLVEFVCSLSADWKIRGGKTKHILREALKGQIPESITDRTKKLGFSTPIDEWLRSEPIKRRFNELLQTRPALLSRYIDFGKLEQLWKRHLSEKKNAGLTLWKVLNIHLWLQRFIDPDRKVQTHKGHEDPVKIEARI